MHDQVKTSCPSPSKANPFPIFIVAVLALALPLVYSTAKAQEPSQFKQHQISMMFGSGDFDTDLGPGTTDDVSPISLGYGFNLTERHGIWVQLTPSTEVDEVPGLKVSYDSTQILYKATFPTVKENIKSYALVGLSILAWNLDYNPNLFPSFVEDGSGLWLAFGAGVDYFVLPEFSLHLSLIADVAREAGDADISTSIAFFGASFHF